MQQQNQIPLRIGFIGAGRVAKGLAWGMAQSGQRIAAAASRRLSSAEQLAARIAGCRATANAQELADCCDLVFVTVPDDAIAAVAASLEWRKDVAVIHCSGATEVAALASAARAGAQIGGFHPLQLFADPEVALAGLPGCTIAIEAEVPLLSQLEQLAQLEQLVELAELAELLMTSPPLLSGFRIDSHGTPTVMEGTAAGTGRQGLFSWYRR